MIKLKNQQTFLLGLICILGGFSARSTLAIAESPADQGWEFQSGVFWDSKYVAEGRDELEAGGIFSLELAATHSGLEFSIWSALAEQINYREVNLTTAYGFDWRGFEMVGGYTHLRFGPGSETDNELFLEVATDLPHGWRLSAGGVYSFDADGTFWELALSYPRSFFEGRILLEPHVLAGFDFGYRTSQHDGFNHLETGISASYAIGGQFEILGYVKHSFAQRDVRREGLGDVSWAGIGMGWTF